MQQDDSAGAAFVVEGLQEVRSVGSPASAATAGGQRAGGDIRDIDPQALSMASGAHTDGQTDTIGAREP